MWRREGARTGPASAARYSSNCCPACYAAAGSWRPPRPSIFVWSVGGPSDSATCAREHVQRSRQRPPKSTPTLGAHTFPGTASRCGPESGPTPASSRQRPSPCHHHLYSLSAGTVPPAHRAACPPATLKTDAGTPGESAGRRKPREFISKHGQRGPSTLATPEISLLASICCVARSRGVRLRNKSRANQPGVSSLSVSGATPHTAGPLCHGFPSPDHNSPAKCPNAGSPSRQDVPGPPPDMSFNAAKGATKGSNAILWGCSSTVSTSPHQKRSKIATPLTKSDRRDCCVFKWVLGCASTTRVHFQTVQRMF